MKEDNNNNTDRKCKHPGCNVVPRDPTREFCASHNRKKVVKTTQEDLNKLSNNVNFVKSGGRSRSHFLITISPNRNADHECKEQFAQLIDYLYGDEQNIKDFFKCKAGRPILIHNITINSGPMEIGDKHGLLNQHTNIYIEHDNLMQVDIQKLRDFIDGVIGHGCHLNVQTPRNDEMKMMSKMNNYANKHNNNYNNNNEPESDNI